MLMYFHMGAQVMVSGNDYVKGVITLILTILTI